MQKNCLLAMLLLILPLHNAIAETAEEKGLAIAVEADERDTGWVDQTADLQMVLTNTDMESAVVIEPCGIQGIWKLKVMAIKV